MFAINQLGTLAGMRGREEPPARLAACLDDDSEPVRAAAASALVSYKRGPERLLPVALRRLPGEGPLAATALTHIFWSFRFPPSCVPMLTAALGSDRWVIRVSAVCALNHMGLDATPARDEVLALLRRELEHPRPAFEVRLVDRADPAQVSESGPNRVILGRDPQGRLHLSVFGPAGGRLADTDESRLADRANVVAALKRDLAGFSPRGRRARTSRAASSRTWRRSSGGRWRAHPASLPRWTSSSRPARRSCSSRRTANCCPARSRSCARCSGARTRSASRRPRGRSATWARPRVAPSRGCWRRWTPRRRPSATFARGPCSRSWRSSVVLPMRTV